MSSHNDMLPEQALYASRHPSNFYLVCFDDKLDKEPSDHPARVDTPICVAFVPEIHVGNSITPAVLNPSPQ